MSPRPRHPRKELEQLLKDAERLGWTVTKTPGGYFKIKCPCDDHHWTMIHLTPSQAYERRKRRWLARETCWENPK